MRILSVGLPFYATAQLGGARTGLVLLLGFAAGISRLNSSLAVRPDWRSWIQQLQARRYTYGVLVLAFLCDLALLDEEASTRGFLLGYLALAMSALFLPPPVPGTGPSPMSVSRTSSVTSISTAPSMSWETARITKSSQSVAVPPLISSARDIDLTLIAGAVLGVLTAVAHFLFSRLTLSYMSAALSAGSVASCMALLVFAQTNSLSTYRKMGLAVGCLLTGAFSIWSEPSDRVLWLSGGILSISSYAAVFSDTSRTSIASSNSRRHSSTSHNQLHGEHSRITGYLLQRFKSGSVMHSVLLEKDSRRIAYFAL